MNHQGPQPLKPGSGWFQGTGEDDRIDRARALVDEAAMEASDPNPARFEKMLVGKAARDVLMGMQARPEYAVKLLAQMVADLEDDAHKQFEIMAGETNSGSDVARDAHFKARVDRAVINLLRKYAAFGEEAELQLNNQSAFEE